MRAALRPLALGGSMQVSSSVSGISRILLVLLLVAGSVALVGGSKSPYSPRDKAYWAPKALVDFVNPGLNITINSAKITSAGVISVTYTLTDPKGLPLDASGATTPGPISLAYVDAYIPKGQEQYVAYTTLELADIFRQYGPAYRQAHALPLH